MTRSGLKMESILEFVDAFKSKNAMMNWFTEYCSDDLVVIVGDDTLSLDAFKQSQFAIIESSPNPVIEIFDIYKQSNGSVYLNAQISGKHTGQPYSYLDYPEIATSGCAWRNDPEIIEFARVGDEVDGSGKIGKIIIKPNDTSASKNGFVGPKGIYQQISLHSPPPA